MRQIIFKKKWSDLETMEFSFQTKDLLEAGIPLIQSVEIVAEQLGGKRREQLLKVRQEIVGGLRLDQAFKTAHFPQLFISLIGMSQAHGKLTDTFHVLGEWYERKTNLRKELIQKLSYPFFLFILIIALFLYLSFFLLPRFQEMFLSFQLELPRSTHILFMLTSFLDQHAFHFGLAIIFLPLTLLFISMILHRKNKLVPLLLALPGISALLKVHYTYFITSQLGILMESGMGIWEALHQIKHHSPFRYLQTPLIWMEEHILSGAPLSSLKLPTEVFHLDFYRLVALGEAQGTLGAHLLMCGQLMEKRIEAWIRKWLRWLEPGILLSLGGMIAFVILSLFLPILTLIQGI